MNTATMNTGTSAKRSAIIAGASAALAIAAMGLQTICRPNEIEIAVHGNVVGQHGMCAVIQFTIKFIVMIASAAPAQLRCRGSRERQ